MNTPAGPGRVRVIGGSLRNSRLQVPLHEGLRPTPERVRETLFNWLAAYLPGARCLDLFAGSGALGIEALSRGALAVDFVEAAPQVAASLRENLQRLHQTQGQVYCQDALAFLGTPVSQRYDLVFLDPPFALDLWAKAAQWLEAGGYLSASAWVYLEYPRQQHLSLPMCWQMYREGKAGEIAYALYRRSPQLG